MSRELTYDDFLSRIDIQDVLKDAGYQLNRRDGLRYPSYVRVDSAGQRVRGDKFIVTQNGLCCFQPPEQRLYNVISLIKEHPSMFADYRPGMSGDRLVNLVCNRLLNNPLPERQKEYAAPAPQVKPFNLKDYSLYFYEPDDFMATKPFYPYFKNRSINTNTQKDFHEHFYLATITKENGKQYTNLAFPLMKPNGDKVIGLEERGKQGKDGKSYKGKAEGSNGSEGLWIANLTDKPLAEVKHILWFESAFDAMAYYQTHRDKEVMRSAAYISTGGNPTERQFRGMIEATSHATHHLCFDNDAAGQAFADNFCKTYIKMEQSGQLVAGGGELSDYLASMRSKNDVLSGDTDLLPKHLATIYGKYESRWEEYRSSCESGLVCKEDLDVLKKNTHEAKLELIRAIKDAIASREPMTITIEKPALPYKDWNDELLGKPDERLVAQQEEVQTSSRGMHR